MKLKAAALAVASLAVAACSSQVQMSAFPAPSVSPGASFSPAPGDPGPGTGILGVYETNHSASFGLIQRFGAAVRHRPNVVLTYSGWWTPFNAAFVAREHAYGAEPLIQIDPNPVKLADVAAGLYDAYLRTYARAVRAFGHPVILSFGHEMNGTWYSWGAGHTSPATFRAAWRHVVDVFRAEGASNVTWLWTVNSTNAASSRLRQWWPGSAWVNWVGIDGYYYRASDTFTSVFGTTIADVRTFTQDPILISETAVGPVAGPSKITNLFAGVRRDRLLGIVWFDAAQHDGIYHQNWRLEDDPAALAAFRAAAAAS